MKSDIFEIISPSGREKNMRDWIKEKAEEMGYSCKTDVFGNLICGEGKTTFECGIDTPSIMKTAADDDGMIKVALASPDYAKSAINKKVRFLNGVLGVVRSHKTEKIEDFDLLLDIGAADKKEANEKIETGEMGSPICEPFETENFIFGCGVSSYIPILTLLEAMKSAKGKAAFAFTAGRRTAGRGISALLEAYDTQRMISLVCANETKDLKCGKGAAVVIKEKGTVPCSTIRKELIAAANGKAQLLVCEERLFLDKAQLGGKGAKTGGICIPVRDKDGAYETVSKSDISCAAEIIINYLKQVD